MNPDIKEEMMKINREKKRNCGSIKTG